MKADRRTDLLEEIKVHVDFLKIAGDRVLEVALEIQGLQEALNEIEK